MNKPRDWYSMSYEEQRAWERQERAVEDAEYESRRAQEEAQNEIRKIIRNTHSEMEEQREYVRQLEDEAYLVKQKERTLRAALTKIVEEYHSRNRLVTDSTIDYAMKALMFDPIVGEQMSWD